MVKVLKIYFDGCDTIEVDWDNVISLGMTDVNKAYQYTKTTTLEMTVANNICLTLSKNADVPHQEFGVGEFTTTFKRLYDCRDITSLSLIHDDGKEEEFLVDYQEVKDIAFGKECRVYLSHYFMPLFSKHRNENCVHLYGHVHNPDEWEFCKEVTKLAQERYNSKSKIFNVGCMLDYMNYTPRTLEQILENGE